MLPRLRRSIQTTLRSLLLSILEGYQPILDQFPALLGDGRGNVPVPNMPGFVYIRYGEEGEDGVSVAYNQVVPLHDGLAITVGYRIDQPRLLQVISQRRVYVGTGQGQIPNVVAHHHTHEYPEAGDPNASGSDMTVGHWRQMRGLRTVVVSSFTVALEPWLVYGESGYRWINYQTLDLVSDRPSAGACYALTYVDSDGVFKRRLGPTVPSPELNVDDHTPSLLAGERPSAVIRLYRGQTSIQETREIKDIWDARWPFAVAFHTILGDSHIDAMGTPVEGDVLTFSNDVWKPLPPTGGNGGSGSGKQVLTPRWHIDGPLAVLDEVDGVWRLSRPFRIDTVVAYVETIGDSDATTVDIQSSVNGGDTWVSIFSVPSNRPSIAGGGSSRVASGSPSTLAEFDAGTFLRACILEAGQIARSLTVQLVGGSEPDVGSDLAIMGCG